MVRPLGDKKKKDFLAAIASAPDDDELKLIYADWLEEIGVLAADWWRTSEDSRDVFTYILSEWADGECQRIDDLCNRIYDSGNGIGATGSSPHPDSLIFELDPVLGITEYLNGNGFGYGTCGRQSGNGLCRSQTNVVQVGGDGYCPEFKIRNVEVLMEGKYILVCDHNWVLVGDIEPHPSDHLRVIVNNCKCVRVWGTDSGLGQLARLGPRPETILDEEGDGVELQRRTILRAIPCNESVWK